MSTIEKLKKLTNGKNFTIPTTHETLVDIFGDDYKKRMFLSPIPYRYALFFEENNKVYYINFQQRLFGGREKFELVCFYYAWEKKDYHYREIDETIIKEMKKIVSSPVTLVENKDASKLIQRFLNHKRYRLLTLFS